MIKTTLFSVCVVAWLCGGVLAQAPPAQTVANTTPGNDKIAMLTPWIGHWKGESLSRMGSGEPKKSTVDERIESKLEGAVLLIEGIGKSIDATTKQETVVHHAMAVLSYDQTDQKYKFRSYLNNGRSADAWFNVISTTQYQWGLDTPKGKTRYTITIDPEKKTWLEIGEFSSDEKTWHKFIDMTLTKTEQDPR